LVLTKAAQLALEPDGREERARGLTAMRYKDSQISGKGLAEASRVY